MTATTPLPGRLAAFVQGMDAALDAAPDEPRAVETCAALLRELVAHDDWLPEDCSRPHPVHYQQYLLHRDPADRYSVVSFVWGPGQRTPVHDHRTWGVIGMLRGAEYSRAYAREDGRLIPSSTEERIEPGQTTCVSPSIGDIHLVRNAYDDRVSISIHVYGTDIGKQSRHVYDAETGAAKSFVSGYANA
ncbi:cysteine dioxygenase [Pigmentiphaga sp. YJ18]|uniref:cysteine dioxygenase family protein n=2 Tax=Pigmentiphaga sp. YJ18 TaxID=3134907 RepID=UPI00310D17DA